MWIFIVFFISVKDLVNGEWDEVKTAMEGNFVTLLTKGPPDKDTETVWFLKRGPLTSRIAQMNKGTVTYFEQSFSGKLHLDQENGSLTIWNIKTSDSGLYKVSLTVKLFISESKYKVNVYAPVSIPVIECNSLVIVDQPSGTLKQPQASEEICSVLCSVRNDRDVSISWYKGSEMMNQTSNPDLNIILSLPLELHCNDSEIYSCMTANPVSNNSVRLHMKEICTQHEDCLDHCCGTKAIRLVLSFLVGIATVYFLVDHVRICSVQKRSAASV